MTDRPSAGDRATTDIAKLVEELRLSVATASNDDLSKPGTYERKRHVARIDAMMAAIDALEAQAREMAEARADLAAQIAGHRHSAKEATTLLIERRDRSRERDRLIATGEALVAALSRYGFPMSEEAWRNTGDDAPANSQASVEARALHRTAVAFFHAVSGACNV